MNAECVRPLLKPPYEGVINDDPLYIDWYVWDVGRKSDLRQFILTYDVEFRQFYATLERAKSTDDAMTEMMCRVPRKMVAIMRSMLPPEEIARCTAASLTLPSAQRSA